MDISHNGEVYRINGNLLLDIEEELRIEALRGWQRNWHLRVMNRVFGRRANYPLNNAIPTKADIGAAISWQALSIRSAEALQRSHDEETPFRHNVPLNPHHQPGYTFYGTVVVNFSDGRAPRTMPFTIRSRQLPTAAEIAAEAAFQANRWVVGTLGGNFASVGAITYTRLQRGD